MIGEQLIFSLCVVICDEKCGFVVVVVIIIEDFACKYYLESSQITIAYASSRIVDDFSTCIYILICFSLQAIGGM